MIWDLIYWLKRTPWDTQVTPPELLELVTRRFAGGGRALDIGCGTGTNALYLATCGFEVVGLDVSRRAIALARRKARVAGVKIDFRVADATRLPHLSGLGHFDLALDIGCFHVLSPSGRAAYALGLRQRIESRGVFLLYAFCPMQRSRRQMGIATDEVAALFADAFVVDDCTIGGDSASGRASAWYTLRRV